MMNFKSLQKPLVLLFLLCLLPMGAWAQSVVKGIVNDEAGEPITVNGILEAMCDSSLTPAKVTARTRQLVAAGVVSKGQVKIDGHKLMAYTLA